MPMGEHTWAGCTIRQDRKRAAQLLQLAADLGVTRAQPNPRKMHEEGEGVVQDCGRTSAPVWV